MQLFSRHTNKEYKSIFVNPSQALPDDTNNFQ